MLDTVTVLAVGALTMLIGTVLGWSLSEATRKRTKLSVNVYDTKGFKLVEKDIDSVE